MRSETNQQSNAATNTKTIDRIRRLRSSSRCSRNDIWPPSSSSPDSFPSSEFLSGKRGITVAWLRPEDFFLPLLLGVERGEGLSVSSYSPSPNRSQREGKKPSIFERNLIRVRSIWVWWIIASRVCLAFGRQVQFPAVLLLAVAPATDQWR